MTPLHAVIMAGGSGTRFWPASRRRRPKQFLPLAHGRSLLAATLDRLHGLVPPERTWIVTNAAQAAALPALLPDFAPQQVLVEPEPRDTAPCIALAAAAIGAREADASMIVLPADHLIEPTAAFQAMLRRGVALAQDGRSLVTFGVAPTHAATGYGYLACGEAIDAAKPPAARALGFFEKPDAATAADYLRRGMLWNSGIFVWTLPALRAAMRQAAPALLAGTEAMQRALQHGDAAAAARAFAQLPRTSIDFAVMEQAPAVVVVRAELQWNDVGSFPALADVVPADADGNHAVLAGGASELAVDSTANVVYAEGARTVALLGVRDLVVVAVDDAVLVCSRERAQDLKHLVERLRSGRSELL